MNLISQIYMLNSPLYEFSVKFCVFLICIYVLYAIDQVGKAGGEKWKSLSDAVSI